MKSTITWRLFYSLISFVAIVCIGVSLLIGKIGGDSLALSFEKIAEILAYMITAISSYYFVRIKNNWILYLVWIICIVLIVILMIV